MTSPLSQTAGWPWRARVDTALRPALVPWLVWAMLFLVAGSVAGILSSVQLHGMPLSEHLGFGRLRSVHLTWVIYGWASMAGFATLVWLLARLCRGYLRFPKGLGCAAHLWGLCVLLGSLAVAYGQQSGVEWQELPVPAMLGLLPVWALLIVEVIGLLRQRAGSHLGRLPLYISGWYLMGSVFWFPFIFVIATLVRAQSEAMHIGGVAQASTTWWYAHNVLGLWFTPVGLAALYYLLPKVVGRPVYSYGLGMLGFWTLAIFYNWAGTHHLIGGPIPRWMVSIGIVGSVMMLVPVLTVAINHHMTVWPAHKLLLKSVVLRYLVFGGVSYTLVSVQGSLHAVRSLNEITHFTHYTVAHAHLGVYGFVSFTLLGTWLYVWPRLMGVTTRSVGEKRLAAWSFTCCAVGIVLYVFALSIGGWLQGLALRQPTTDFLQIVTNLKPWMYARSGAGLLMLTGHILWIVLMYKWWRKRQHVSTPQKTEVCAPLCFRMASVGVIAVVLVSAMGLVWFPKQVYAPNYDVAKDSQTVAQGREVYIREGCVYCHTQQMRPFGGDLERGWGKRRSLPEDLHGTDLPLLGTMRTGPDLADIGWRLDDADWHHLHLFAPEVMSESSVMPAYAHLYEVLPATANIPEHAVALEAVGRTVGYLVPSEDAQSLVAYLVSLQLEPLPEPSVVPADDTEEEVSS